MQVNQLVGPLLTCARLARAGDQGRFARSPRVLALAVFCGWRLACGLAIPAGLVLVSVELMTKPKLFTIVLVTAGFAAQAVLFSADKKAAPVPTAPAAQAGLLGEFSGEWRGKDDSSGTLKVKFSRGQDAAWTAQSVFAFEGTEIPTTTKSVKVDGVKVELVFAWQVQGTSAASTLKGELQGDKLEGTYESTTAEGAATGTWKTTRTPARS